jgi:hypothetical protein
MTQLELWMTIGITSYVIAAGLAIVCGGLLAYIKHLRTQIKK